MEEMRTQHLAGGRTILIQNAEGDPNTSAHIVVQNEIGYEPKVSVIIPVYNTEAYLRECLNSVVNQTLREIEIICIDDGSTDSSLPILKEYALKDPRISILQQENLHSGVARNAGIAIAKGKYLVFLDSDDFFETSMLEKMYNQAEDDESDIVICSNSVYDSRLKRHIRETKLADKYLKISPFQPIDVANKLYTISNPNAWTKLFLAKQVKDNEVRFESTLSCNDITFVCTMLSLVNRISLLNENLVHYRTNSKTNITENRAQCVDCFIKAAAKLYQNLKKRNILDSYIITYLDRIKKSWVWELSRCPEEEREKWTRFAEQMLPPQVSAYITDRQERVSVIIPVYNTEKYLRRCLDSVENQTLKEIEIICINDGSTDNSMEILKEYAKKDSRVVVITQKNQGPSRTRNNALQIVRGKYVSFLDSDDWLTENALELLYEYSSHFDLDMVNFEGCNYDELSGQFFQLPSQMTSYISEEKKYYTAEDISRIAHKIPISVCRYFYRAKFLTCNNLLFPGNLFFEDNLFVLNALSVIKRYGIIRKVLYNRTVRGTSTTQNWSLFFGDYMEVIYLIAKLVKSQAFFQTTSHHILNRYLTNSIKAFESFSPICQDRYRRKLRTLYSRLSHNFRLPQSCIDFLSEDDTNDSYAKGLKAWYETRTGEYLNIENPRTFNEKIQWLKLYDSTPIKTKLADKYLVREWVKEKIGEKYLIPLLGVYDRFDDINFDQLPNQFVIKCNHGSGYNIVVQDKSQLDLAAAKLKVDRWMSENFALRYGFELHYRDIKPKILIEKYMDDNTGDLRDYKYTCFNGTPEFIWIDSDRHTEHKRNLYDLSWKQLPYKVNTKYDTFPSPPKPDCLEEMTKLAGILSQGFPYVRVDFYIINGRIYFGEMTFTSSSGTEDFYPKSFEKMISEKLVLPPLAYDIDTGEYYKLRRKSRLALCLRLLLNWYRRHCLTEIFKSLCEEHILKQLEQARIDIKNVGAEGNAVEVEAKDSIITKPGWFKNAKGAGQVLTCFAGKGKIRISTITEGKLTVSFRGPDMRFEGKRFPLWNDYKSIKIDGKEVLPSPIAVWHDKPWRYEMPVKDGQEVWIEYERQAHPYSREELKETILKLNPTSEVIPEIIDALTDKIIKTISHAK